MSDWWYSDPEGGGWFGEYRESWQKPTHWRREGDPAGWMGTYRPHWQRPDISEPYCARRTSDADAAPSRYSGDAPPWMWFALMALVLFFTPYGDKLLALLTSICRWAFGA